MVYLGDGWGEVVLPSPGSEPPPPYSPPRVPHRHHQHFFPEAFGSSSHPHHLHPHHPSSHLCCRGHIPDYYDVPPSHSSLHPSLSLDTTNRSRQPLPPEALLDTKSMKDPPPPYPPTPYKSTHPALNHGPSSAFSPPTKSIKYSYPPPYTPKDASKDEAIGTNQGKVVPPALSNSTTTGTIHHSRSSHHPSDLNKTSVSSNGINSTTGPRSRHRRSHHYPQDKTRSLEHHQTNGRRERDTSRSVSGSRGHHQVNSPSERIRASNGTKCGSVDINAHPKGPLLKTGKSLELPLERLSSYHHTSVHLSSTKQNSQLHSHHPHHYSSSHAHHQVPPTAHIHPGHSSHNRPTKDFHLQETKEPMGNFSKSSKLAYVGIMPSKTHSSRRSRERDLRVFRHAKENQLATERLQEQQNHSLDPRLSRNDDRWARRTSKLEAAAAQAMMPVRAVPVTAVGQSPGRPSIYISHEPEIGYGRGRLRSCRSLDELSDFLDEDLPRLPVATTRSLDDLTEPLYENLDVIHAHARDIQNTRISHNTSVPDLLEPPPRLPRQRNNSLSSLLDDLAQCGAATALSRRALNTSVPDVLERGVNTGIVGREMGVLSWSSPTSTLRSGASTLRSNQSNNSTLRSAAQEADNTSDIGVQLQKIKEVARVLGVKYRNGELSSSSCSSSGAPSTHTSPRMPTHMHSVAVQAPGVPARAPVIHDVLKDARKSSPQQHPDNDVASQESGYSSMDSRSCRQLQQQQQQQNHYLRINNVHNSYQYSPERLLPKDSPPEHHQQPLSLPLKNTNNNRLYRCSNGPPSIDHFQDRGSEKLMHNSKQHQKRPAIIENQNKNPEYGPNATAPKKPSRHHEGKVNTSRHPYPSRDMGTQGPLPSHLQEKNARQPIPPSYQVPQEVVIGHHTHQIKDWSIVKTEKLKEPSKRKIENC